MVLLAPISPWYLYLITRVVTHKCINLKTHGAGHKPPELTHEPLSVNVVHYLSGSYLKVVTQDGKVNNMGVCSGKRKGVVLLHLLCIIYCLSLKFKNLNIMSMSSGFLDATCLSSSTSSISVVWI